MEETRKKAKRKVMEGMSFEEKFEFVFNVSFFAMWIVLIVVTVVLHAVGIV